jgi:hypothetical protein
MAACRHARVLPKQVATGNGPEPSASVLRAYCFVWIWPLGGVQERVLLTEFYYRDDSGLAGLLPVYEEPKAHHPP